MKLISSLTVIIALTAFPLEAKESLFDKDSGKFLIESCREVLDIYKRRDETSLLAAHRTSLSEGMRAGYCIGVLQQYSKTDQYCRYSRNNWFEMAKVIANISLPEAKLLRVSADKLLKEAYCGR